MNTFESRPARRFWLPLAALFALLLALAGVRPLAVPDEGRYAEVSRWMLASGDWLIPRLDGLPFFHKPPLTHWEQAASLAVFGISPWAARLPEVLLALLLVAGLYGSARRLAGRALAERAALMLAASGAVLVGGQYVNHDMGVAAWIASAIWCFALAFTHGEQPHAGWARAGFAACALGVLTKGLIGLALPGLVLFLWISWTRQWRKVWRLPWVTGLLIFGVIAVPWFVLAGQRYPGLWGYLFGVQQFERYTGAGFNNEHGVWFYPLGLLVLLLPWGFFACFEALAQVRQARAATKTEANVWAPLCWIWLGAILVFFSIPRSKLIGYILPALPPLALLAAAGWQRAMGGRRHAGRWFGALAVLVVALSLGVTFALPWLQRGKLSADVARTLACRIEPGDEVLAAYGYPYEVPFQVNVRNPMIVIQDWPLLERAEADSWRRVLFEAGRFEPSLAAQVLRTPDFLHTAVQRPGYWLLAKHAAADASIPPGWQLVERGQAWSLWRSAGQRPAGHRLATVVRPAYCAPSGR